MKEKSESAFFHLFTFCDLLTLGTMAFLLNQRTLSALRLHSQVWTHSITYIFRPFSLFLCGKMWTKALEIDGFSVKQNIMQKADDSVTLSKRGFHVELGAREKAVSISCYWPFIHVAICYFLLLILSYFLVFLLQLCPMFIGIWMPMWVEGGRE